MTLLDKYKYTESEIPTEDLVFIDLLRKFLRDDATLNVLLKTEENTNIQLYHALLMALDDINNTYQPITTYADFSKLPSWNMLAFGATLNILTSEGILSARNTLTYSDSGGVTVQDYDKYGRYINYFNVLINKYVQMVKSWKESLNISSVYGGTDNGQASEYALEW